MYRPSVIVAEAREQSAPAAVVVERARYWTASRQKTAAHRFSKRGEGYSRVSSATVHRAILKRLPDLHQSSWSRNWKPFYEMLVDALHKGERQASSEFEKATTY